MSCIVYDTLFLPPQQSLLLPLPPPSPEPSTVSPSPSGLIVALYLLCTHAYISIVSSIVVATVLQRISDETYGASR